MPIRRHGKGWEVRIQHGGTRYSRTVATRSDAQFLEATWRRRFNDSRAGRTPSYTFGEALERWAAEEYPRLKSQKSHKSLLKAILPHTESRMLDEALEVAEAIRSAGLKAKLAPAPSTAASPSSSG